MSRAERDFTHLVPPLLPIIFPERTGMNILLNSPLQVVGRKTVYTVEPHSLIRETSLFRIAISHALFDEHRAIKDSTRNPKTEKGEIFLYFATIIHSENNEWYTV